MASDIGLVICHKMTDIEASAMWIEANISFTAARVILRHLHTKFGKRLQVPFSQISILSNVTNKIVLSFGEYKYKKTENCQKIAEIMKYWTTDPIHLLELDFGRLLESNQDKTTFGYTSKLFQTTKQGVYAIIGSDHGGGKSRYLLRINYLHSSHRRKVKKVDAGTRTVQFAEVSCKKDVHQIQSVIAPVVNKAIKDLESSMLIAIKIENEQEITICKFLPANASNISYSITDKNRIRLHYTTPESTILHFELKTSASINSERIPPIHIWTVIQSFKVVIAGDLSFFATSTGRDGHSHVRCTYCDLSSSDWNNGTSTSPNKMTLARLHSLSTMRLSSKCPKKIDSKGVVMRPLLNIEPKFYIVPILHLFIGVVNKLWTSLLLFMDEFVERISEHESILKTNINEYKCKLREIDEIIDILTVNKQMACEEYNLASCIDAKETIDICRKDLKTKKSEKTDTNKELKKLKADLMSEQLKRKGDATGIDNLLFLILEESKIKKQHFHGGSMNGVCCRRLLDSIDTIFDKVTKLVSEKLKERCKTKEDIEYITLVLNKFRDLFEVVDLVFYRLRILDLTDEEITKTTIAISVMNTLWKEMDLNKGPKLHILFDHAIEQIELFKGIADLVEDFVEKYHQVGKKLDYLVARMSAQSFRQQEMVKIRRQWLTTNPSVHNRIDSVHQHLKRKKNTIHLHDNQKANILSILKQERKKVKRETTERKSHFDMF